MPPRRVLKLAERLERIAHELETVDSHPFGKQTFGMVPAEDQNKFSGLPELLRRRAFILHIQAKLNRRLYPLIERGIEKHARLNLIDFVRQSTEKHRPMYTQVALLLTAALYEVGCDEVVTPESLRTLWHDDPTRGKTLENPT